MSGAGEKSNGMRAGCSPVAGELKRIKLIIILCARHDSILCPGTQWGEDPISESTAHALNMSISRHERGGAALQCVVGFHPMEACVVAG